jgi:hypothetical protein
LATSLASFAGVIGTFDRSFQVNGNVDLEVLTRSGDITVRNGLRARFRFMPRFTRAIPGSAAITKPRCRSCRTNPPIRQNGNSIRIDYVNLNNISIDYEITVPENTAVRTHTGSGDQTGRRPEGQYRS